MPVRGLARQAATAAPRHRPADLARPVAGRGRVLERAERPAVRCSMWRPCGRSAGRRCWSTSSRSAARRARGRPPARRGRGPRRPGSSACSRARPASTGRSCRPIRTTRWHGTMSGTGLWPSAVPTARTALGRPISAAIQPYGRTSPRGMSRALRQTSRSKSVWPRRSRSMRTRRSPPSRRSIARARSAGSASRRERPGARSGPRGSRRTSRRTATPLDAAGRSRPRTSGPIGESMRAIRSARPTSARTSGASGSGRGRGEVGHGGLQVAVVGGHAVISSRSSRFAVSNAVRNIARPRWTWALTVPSGRPRARARSG